MSEMVWGLQENKTILRKTVSNIKCNFFILYELKIRQWRCRPMVFGCIAATATRKKWLETSLFLGSVERAEVKRHIYFPEMAPLYFAAPMVDFR